MLFLGGAAIMALVAAYAALRPKCVFDNLRKERMGAVEPFKDIRTSFGIAILPALISTLDFHRLRIASSILSAKHTARQQRVIG